MKPSTVDETEPKSKNTKNKNRIPKLSVFVLFFFIISCITDPFVKKMRSKGENVLNLEYTLYGPTVSLYLNIPKKGKTQFNFLIDTGSNISLLNSVALASETKPQKYSVKSISKKQEVEYSKVHLDLRSSDRYLQTIEFYTQKFPDIFPFDGILGNDFLSKYTVVLNFPEYLALLENHSSKDITEDNFYVGVSFQFIYGHILIPVYIERKNYQFIFDTGATFSSINPEDLPSTTIGNAKEFQFYDILGEVQTSKLYYIKGICILTDTLCETQLQFASTHSIKDFFEKPGLPTHGLIGMNWIKKYRIMIDYKQSLIYVHKK
jgi:predicted aspartyl protease